MIARLFQRAWNPRILSGALGSRATGVAKFYSGDNLNRDFRARQLFEPKTDPSPWMI
jgi:hypothetical protein